VQSVWRRFWHHRRYLLCLTGTIIIQAHARRRIARRAYREHIYAKHGARLVAVVVTLATRRRFMNYRRAITTLQNRYRAKLARKDLTKRRKEAKDTDKLKQSNDALKAEIEALKVKAAAESATREKQLQEQARQQALQEAEAQLQEQKEREEAERANAERLLEEERKKREETETLRAQEQLEFSKIVAELTAAKEALDAERLSRESLMQKQASEMQQMQQPQHESDALLAEIAMLSDLLEDERKMRAQVEEELVEALKVCSGERAGRLEAETRLEVLEIHSKLPGSGNGNVKSPFNAGDQSSIMSPGIEDTWAAVGSMHGSGRDDSSIASEQSPGAGTCSVILLFFLLFLFDISLSFIHLLLRACIL
jgi:myosin heavy subunit